MAREKVILVCISIIVTQLVVVSSDDIDWTTVHDELRKLGASIRKKCIGETGITNEALEAADVGDFDDDKLPCYLKCIMEKGGVMKKDGKINHKILSKMIPQAFKKIGQEMLEECRDIKGTDNCDIAMNFNECMFKSNPVAFFVI